MRFEWLKNYQDLEDQILFLKWNLNKSKLELDRWISGDLAKIRIEKNSRSSKLEETIIAIEDELKILADQKEELLKIIDTFKGLENEIVRLKYIEDCSLEEIAEKTGYSESYIRKKHSEIRSILTFLDDYESNAESRQSKKNDIEYYGFDKKYQQTSLF
ncbi:sigma-70 family RNA polymerase sigma factor [Enterococcus cecorum]|nr:sigma-70 family RNA polymerase sigma factor [Enterococcus cecorum]CAI3391742.1 sigma-70 family RNA polymerase sigma factor [Enterococcus cecorum]CAI3520175.1 sigma-70 family RNA polymerase sigma factor [Enterococcus cecorum]